MTTWFTSDLHFGHRNIIGYCERPFDDVDQMNETLVDNWNDTVADDDTVWVLGDASVLACHFPSTGDSQAEERHVEHRPVDVGEWLLHGHVHEQWATNGRMINVGVDVRHQRTISEGELAAIIAAG